MKPTERAQVLYLQIVGSLALVGVFVVAAYVGRDSPAAGAAIATSGAGLIGKLFGEPLRAITLNQVRSMPPLVAAQVAERAIASLPPEAQTQLAHARLVLTGFSTAPPPAKPPDGTGW